MRINMAHPGGHGVTPGIPFFVITGAGSMFFKLFRPNARLSKYIRNYYYFYNAVPGDIAPGLNRYPADGGAKLVMNLGDPFLAGGSPENLKDFSGGRLLGPLSHRMASRPGQRTAFLAVRFRPGQVMRFFKVPDRDLADDSVGIETLWGASGRRFTDRITHMRCIREMFTHMEEKLLMQLEGKQEPDHRMGAAIDLITRSNGNIRIKTLAAEVQLSVRQLERRFLYSAGIHPKRLCRISRFKGLLAGIEGKAGNNWAARALESGYSDQAHLIREFNYFTGRTPENYIANRSPLENAIWSRSSFRDVEPVGCRPADGILNPLLK